MKYEIGATVYIPYKGEDDEVRHCKIQFKDRVDHRKLRRVVRKMYWELFKTRVNGDFARYCCCVQAYSKTDKRWAGLVDAIARLYSCDSEADPSDTGEDTSGTIVGVSTVQDGDTAGNGSSGS